MIITKIISKLLPLTMYIDKEPSIPSVYFIGKDGTPLDIIKGVDDLSNLSLRIDSILSKAGIVIKSGKNLKSIKFNLVPTKYFSVVAEAPQPVELSKPEIVCEDGVCKIVNKEQQQTNDPSTSAIKENVQLTPEEKVVRAKELIEKKRREREMEEKQVW